MLEIAIEVKSYRSSDPVNEFNPTDELLTSTFPCVFPLGSCFKRSAGNLNNEQLNHLLKQFHMIPSKDKRLLGYLADIRRRSEVIKKAKMKITSNENSIELVNDFLN